MNIQVYNSLTKKKEPLKPLKEGVLTMYACGVTVYDRCHIGHARSLYIFDVVRRYLKYRGFKVRFIRNITDIDDKIIQRAVDQGRRWDEVARDNIGLYEADLESLGLGRADVEPRASENIPGMVKHIQGLIDKGFAYASQGNVYFRVRRFADYGKLSGQSIEKMLEAVRIEKDARKEDPLDFALWKKSDEQDARAGWKYESLWGAGRPGWHIECSVMSMKYAGAPTLDIHAGGRDLIFPHHENEIAQSEALTGGPFARYWLHHGLLTIDGQKMAKSLGNFITIEDALKQYDADDLKMLFLSAHYASTLDFTGDKMAEAGKALRTFKRFLADAKRLAGPPKGAAGTDLVQAGQARFLEAMDDDFNTPRALAVLHELVHEVNRRSGESGYALLLGPAAEFVKTVLTEVFGIGRVGRNGTFVFNVPDKKNNVDELLKEREQARTARDFKRADQIRDTLSEMGYIIEDTPGGARVIRK